LYDAGAGIFTSVDPVFADIHRTGGLNAYGYVYGNPFSFVDPDGRRGTALRNNDLSTIFALSNFRTHQNYACNCNNSALIAIPDFGYQVSVGVSSGTFNSLDRLSSRDIESVVASVGSGNMTSMTLYRGDISGQPGFVAKGIRNGKYTPGGGLNTLMSSDDLTMAMFDHAVDSENSLFVSTTDNILVAEGFAALGKGRKQTTSVYTLNVPAGRAIKNLNNYTPNGMDIQNPWSPRRLVQENEWLVPLYIPSAWITSEVPYTGPSL